MSVESGPRSGLGNRPECCEERARPKAGARKSRGQLPRHVWSTVAHDQPSGFRRGVDGRGVKSWSQICCGTSLRPHRRARQVPRWRKQPRPAAPARWSPACLTASRVGCAALNAICVCSGSQIWRRAIASDASKGAAGPKLAWGIASDASKGATGPKLARAEPRPAAPARWGPAWLTASRVGRHTTLDPLLMITFTYMVPPVMQEKRFS